MKETVMYANYNRTANKVIYDLLSKLSNEEREKDRGSYYGSLSGLFRHVTGGTVYFLGLFRETLKGNQGAAKALSALESVSFPPDGPLGETQWKELAAVLSAVDSAYLGAAEAIGEADMTLPVKIDWYGGNPASSPLSFMLSQLVVHNTHHRGQISQILDSLKIDNNYSGIGLEFLPK